MFFAAMFARSSRHLRAACNCAQMLHNVCTAQIPHNAQPAIQCAQVPVCPCPFTLLLEPAQQPKSTTRCQPWVCLPLVVLRSQVVPYRRDERVELCKKCDSPHDVHCGGGEHKGRSPDAVVSMLVCSCVHRC